MPKLKSDFDKIVTAIFELRDFGEYTDFDALDVHENFRQHYYFVCDVIEKLRIIDNTNLSEFYARLSLVPPNE